MYSMRMDLSFTMPELEKEFYEVHGLRNQRLEKQFHYARSLTWLVVLLRALTSGQRCSTLVVALGTLATLLPAFLDHLPRRQYLRLRLPVEICDNILQVALGCFAHHQGLCPSSQLDKPTSFQMAAVLLAGNGVAWLLFCSLWSSLPFRYALPQQAALTIMLLLHNRQLCQHSTAIQLAYSAVQLSAVQRTKVLLSRLSGLPLWQHLEHAYAAGRSCSAAVLASPAGAREAVRVACMEAARAAHAAAAAQGPPEASREHGAMLCMLYQPASLLLLGFLLPLLYVWTSELRLRRQFLAARAASNGAAAALSTNGRRSAEPHVPSLLDFSMFVVPAVAAMFTFVSAQG